MKKIMMMALMLAVSTSVWAQNRRVADPQPVACQYTVLQKLVRDARNHEKIFELIRAGVSMDDPTITCGGSLLQLAIRRGNPSILNGILTQDKTRANAPVSLVAFPIAEAPESVPAILFAAYYAPSEVVLQVMLNAGANVALKDSKGHDILWYLEKNPVLRKTRIEDNIQLMLQQKLLDEARRKNLDNDGAPAVGLVLEQVPDTPSNVAVPTP